MMQDSPVDVLLVEDNPNDAQLVKWTLTDQLSSSGTQNSQVIAIGEITHVSSLRDALSSVVSVEPDIILLDLDLPDSRGIETVERVSEHIDQIPIVVLTGHPESELGVEAIQRGAQDFICKETLNNSVLVRTLRYAVERARIKHELSDATHRLTLVHQLVRKDIRTEVNLIIGEADVLRTTIDSHADAVDRILNAGYNIAEKTDTAVKLTDTIVSDTIAYQPFVLNQQLSTAVATVQSKSDATIECSYECSSTQSRANSADKSVDEVISIAGSPMVSSALTHLLENAVERSTVPTDPIVVTVTADSDVATVEIANTGDQLPIAHEKILCNPHHQRDQTATVGLQFAAVVLVDLGCRVTVAKNQPSGSVISIEFDRT